MPHWSADPAFAVPRASCRGLRVLVSILLGLILLISSAPAESEYHKESGMFFDTFDTVVILSGYVRDRETFDAEFSRVQELFEHFHRIFDPYHAYEGIKNLYYMNRHAAEGYITVEPELFGLLRWLKKNQPAAHGRVNVALGAVLNVWHAYRTEGKALPDMETLRNANLHTSFDDVLLNEENGTVRYADADLIIDLGAVAKGYTVQIAADMLDAGAMPSYILNAGGNVRCGASPLDGRECWGVAIQDPDDPNQMLDCVYLKNASVVTSGDYQRYYELNGRRYHHIIDPDTLMPSDYMRSVTVVTADSGLADLLSTALFNLPYAEGRKLAEGLDGVDAVWVLADGTVQVTDGLNPMLRSNGAPNAR